MLQFDSQNLPRGVWSEYRKTAITKAIQMTEDFEVITIDGNVARGRAGDYLMVDSAGHPYPCNRYEFAASYVEMAHETESQAA